MFVRDVISVCECCVSTHVSFILAFPCCATVMRTDVTTGRLSVFWRHVKTGRSRRTVISLVIRETRRIINTKVELIFYTEIINL